MSGLPGPVRQQLNGSARMEIMTPEKILPKAQALMTVEVDGPVDAVAGGRRVLPRVPMDNTSNPNKQYAVAV